MCPTAQCSTSRDSSGCKCAAIATLADLLQYLARPATPRLAGAPPAGAGLPRALRRRMRIDRSRMRHCVGLAVLCPGAALRCCAAGAGAVASRSAHRHLHLRRRQGPQAHVRPADRRVHRPGAAHPQPGRHAASQVHAADADRRRTRRSTKRASARRSRRARRRPRRCGATATWWCATRTKQSHDAGARRGAGHGARGDEGRPKHG